MSGKAPTLIRSKLQVPVPSGLVHRARLCSAIERGLERKLTLISAPAGYGKTSALVDFAQHTSAPICWYTVDERDRDLSLFVRYITGAIEERFRGFGAKTREVVRARRGALFREPTAVVGDLANEMLDIDADFVLIIDNFEPVEGALGIAEFIHRLLEVLPSNCHLMMGSRVLPDVPVTQLVAKRELVGLTESHLRFEPEEIEELFADSGIRIRRSKANEIARKSEGWITGILLIWDLIREDVDTALDTLEIGTAQTYSYLASEVLNRQPWEVRRFLSISSVLDEMSTRSCREALGIDGARFLLADVERRNLFVTRFGDDSRAVYRYHDLFRDFLQERLRQQEPARYAEFHRRAAAWFAERHQVEDAVKHYLLAEDYPQATALMERVAMEWFTRGRGETLLHWMKELPEGLRHYAPRSALYQGKILTDRYEYRGARQALSDAEVGFSERGDSTQLARVHLQRAEVQLFEGKYEDVLEQARLALAALDSDGRAERAQARRMLGNAEISLGRWTTGVANLEKALALYREIGSPYDVVNLIQDLAYALAGQGRFNEAASYLTEALPLARRLESSSQLAGVLNSLGWIRYARGKYREALKLYNEGLVVARRGHDPRSEGNIADSMATIYRDLGDYQRAELLYDVAWRIAGESRPDVAVLILAARADMYRWQGDPGRALTVLEQASDLAERRGLNAEVDGVLRLGQGIALAEDGDVQRGLESIEAALSFLSEQGAKQELARGRLLFAKALFLGGESQRAVEHLRQALNLSAGMGTDQFAVVEGQHTRELLALGVSEGVLPCRRVLEEMENLDALKRDLIEGVVERRAAPEGYLKIHALGGGCVLRQGRPISSSEWRAAMAKELFFYILLRGPVERDTAGLVFWPNLPAEKVTSNFHSTLYRVRQAVGSEAVVLERGKYRVGVDYTFDVQQFESLVERARLLPRHDWQAEDLWRQAVELYGGDFLPEVERAWCVPKREALRTEYIEALFELARCHEARGALEEAVSWYRQALDEDELREDLHRSIICVYAELGRLSDVHAQYRDCQDRLRQELDVEPSRETQKLYEEVTGRMPRQTPS